MKLKKPNLRIISFTLIFTILLSNLLFLKPIKKVFAAGKTTVIIHYAKDLNSKLDWNLWVWELGKDGKKYTFTGKDDFGEFAEISFDDETKKVGFIVRTDDWKKDIDADRFIEKFKNGHGEIWLKAGDPKIYTVKPHVSSSPAKLGASTKVTVHYNRYDGEYKNWNAYVWPEGGKGIGYTFTSKDSFGQVASFTVPNTKDISKLGIIVRQSVSGNDWTSKDTPNDRFITDFNKDGSAEIWVVQDDPAIYYSPSEIDNTPSILVARLNELNAIDLQTNIPFAYSENSNCGFEVFGNGQKLTITKVESSDAKNGFTRSARVILDKNIDLNTQLTLGKKGYDNINVTLGDVMSSDSFNNLYYYDANDLGNTYSKNKTGFKVWAPTASEAKLVAYKKWDDKDGTEIDMKRGEKGTWSTELTGDQNGLFYTYKVKIGNTWNEAVDPYVRSVSVNGDKGAVIDLTATNPEKWDPKSKPYFKNPTDAIIYELHIRDFSMDKNSGIKNKGKFLGLTETGTKSPDGTSTGIDHIKDLGVTHVQLLPIYDYSSVDETEKNPSFNWGYDPKNYNSPEGSYSTDPYKPSVRVNELKQAIQSLHNNNLRVVMDVVYNHMYSADSSNFNKLVPGYYFRYNKDGSYESGSGCGNDIASDHKMARKFIVDSVSYWAKEYNIDGFRFDLMGLLDIDTMNEVRSALNKIDPSILVIGEGWNMPSYLPDDQKAAQINASTLPGIADFNDTIRDGIKGSVFDQADAGFVNGKPALELNIKKGVVGATDYSSEIQTWGNVQPSQSVNYCEAHDNNTLWDKLELTNPNDSVAVRTDMHKLADAIVLTSQGIPFIQAGQEFMRTKYGDGNSYKSVDSINQLDWTRNSQNKNIVNYFEGLITLRKQHPAFRMTTADMIKNNLKFINTPADVVAYNISGKPNGEKWDNIVVAFNANKKDVIITLPKNSKWNIVVNKNNSGTKTIQVVKGSTITVPALSTIVLYERTTNLLWLYTSIVVVASAIFALFMAKRKKKD